MAKTTKPPTTAKKPAATPVQKSSIAGGKAAAQDRLKAEHEESYQANKKRVDEALKLCLKHFKDGEHDVVRIVGRMLHDHYIKFRAQTPKGGGFVA